MSLRAVRRRPALPPVLLLATALLVSAWLSAAGLRDPATTWPGDPGDPEQTQFFLAWLPHALGHGLDPLVTHFVLYPHGANLMWNTSVPLPALLISPVTVLFGPTAAYGVLFFLAAPVTAATGYFAFRRWASPVAAAVAAFAFAFSPFFRGQSDGHLHLMLLALVPLTLLIIDEIVIRRRWRWWVSGALLGLLAVAQLMTAEEILAMDAVVAVVAIALLAIRHRSAVPEAFPYVWRAGAVALAVFFVLAAYPLFVQFAGPYRVQNAIHSSTEFSTDLLNFVLPTDQVIGGNTHWGWAGNSAEWAGYLGVPLLVVLWWQWRRGRRPAGRWAAGLAVVTAALSLGPWLHVAGWQSPIPLPWLPLAYAPIAEQILPGRLMLYAALFACLALAVLIDDLKRRPAPLARAGAALAGVAVAASWLPAPQIATTVTTPPGFTAAARSVDARAALLLPMITGPRDESPQLLLARAGFPFRMPSGWVIVGSSLDDHHGPATTTFRQLASPGPAAVSASTAAALRAEWRRWGIGAVIVAARDPAVQRRMVRAVATVLGGARPAVDGEAAVFDLRLAG